MSEFDLGRRRVMQAVGAGLLLPGLAPAVIASVKDRPQLTDGVQSGDLLGDRAMVWSRSDRPARMVVEHVTQCTPTARYGSRLSVSCRSRFQVFALVLEKGRSPSNSSSGVCQFISFASSW
jgi:phosphodiesterase/alkaline phosphatase D-like protein